MPNQNDLFKEIRELFLQMIKNFKKLQVLTSQYAHDNRIYRDIETKLRNLIEIRFDR